MTLITLMISSIAMHPLNASQEGGKIQNLQNQVWMCPYGVLGVRSVLETVFTHKKIHKTRKFDDDPYYPHDFKYRNAPAWKRLCQESLRESETRADFQVSQKW